MKSDPMKSDPMKSDKGGACAPPQPGFGWIQS